MTSDRWHLPALLPVRESIPHSLEQSGWATFAARDGDVAPGASDSARFRYIDNAPAVLNNAGDVGFVACACDGSSARYGIWLARASVPSVKIAMESDPAPGVSGGTFGVLYYSIPCVNARGQVAFLGGLSGTGARDDGIWATNRAGELQLVARKGGTLQVRPGDIRVITSVNLTTGSGGGNGLGRGLNDRGEVAFSATFSDGSAGIFVASLGPRGDLNCDGVVDSSDIAAFVLEIFDPAAFAVQFPLCNPLDADLNADGELDGRDIQPFVDLLL